MKDKGVVSIDLGRWGYIIGFFDNNIDDMIQ